MGSGFLFRLGLGFGGLFTVWAVGATNPVPLSTIRSSLHLPDYTPAERVLVANQAQFFLDNLYVHRDLKIHDFGASADPVPHLKQLVDSASTMPDSAFQDTASQIFLNLHDLHTNYEAPAPLACGVAEFPLVFKRVQDHGQNVVVVSKLLASKKLPGISDVSLGDVLVEVDGQKTETALENLKKISDGANDDAMTARALELLTIRAFTTDAMPEKDTVKVKLEASDGHLYDEEFPWFAMEDQSCVHPKPQGRFKFHLPFGLNTAFNLAEDPYQRRYNEIVGQPGLQTEDQTWLTPDSFKDIFQVSEITTSAGKFGNVQIKAFYWSDQTLDVETVIDALRQAIETKLGDADGLIIDVRQNPGGLVNMAEKLVQLFTSKKVEPTTVHMVANDLNEKIFLKSNEGRDNRWSEAIRDAEKAHKEMTENMPLTPPYDVNDRGQIWFKPVAVLTDASCFSACDIFSAGMQDNGAAVVVGVDHSTGAGGANVMEYKTFEQIMGGDKASDNPFLPLPYKQNMRIAWRQSVRSGLHQGELIEDVGVKSDYLLSIKRDDIKEDTKNVDKVVLEQVAQILGGMKSKYVSSIATRPSGLVALQNGSGASWDETVQGVDSIDVLVNDQKVGHQDVPYSLTPAKINLEVKSLQGSWDEQLVTLLGSHNGVPVLRSVRQLLWRGVYPQLPSKGLKIDIAKGNLNGLRTVLLRGPADSGWQVVDGYLRIGRGPNYQPNVLARAFVPVQLDGKGAAVDFDIGLLAEQYNDWLSIYALNPDTGERHNYFAGSELPPTKGIEVELPKGWNRADFVFEFQSDENWNMTGPVIPALAIKPLSTGPAWLHWLHWAKFLHGEILGPDTETGE